MKSFAEIDRENSLGYIDTLVDIAGLSCLFSDDSVPFVHYRAHENIFCLMFNARNLSREDGAFDAEYGGSIGVGLKTFTSAGTEKVAEFNKLFPLLNGLGPLDSAKTLAKWRNDRILLHKRKNPRITDAVYHILVRQPGALIPFEYPYETIDETSISILSTTQAGLKFEDGKHKYNFNYSKSTLFMKFEIPAQAERIPVNILPINQALLAIKQRRLTLPTIVTPTNMASFIVGVLSPVRPQVILPLYGRKDKQRFVFEKSGLNQWNAGGRQRDLGEIYIPIPAVIHELFPSFFPDRDLEFVLILPDGTELIASVCQQGRKALMTNPNNALAKWLLRDIFQLEEGQLATIERMDLLDFDSVLIVKLEASRYTIDKAKSGSYERQVGEHSLVAI